MSQSGHFNWKIFAFLFIPDILAPCLIVSVADQSPILGEVSILRYLSRLLLPDLFSQVEPLQMANIDAWLNAAMKLTMSDNGIERKAFIQSLNCHLGKHKWLVNNAASLADIYCSIALIKTNDRGLFPNNVEKWISTCKKELPGFQDVKKMWMRHKILEILSVTGTILNYTVSILVCDTYFNYFLLKVPCFSS